MTYPPLTLSGETEDERSYFDEVAGMWSGPGPKFALGQASGGLSVAYTVQGIENAVVVFGIDFKDKTSGTEAANVLGMRYGGQANYWVKQSGNMVSVVSTSARTPQDCVSAFVKKLEGRLMERTDQGKK